MSGPQERVLRRIVEQIVDSALVAPILEVPVPQMVSGEVADVLEPLPRARVLEPAAGVDQDLPELERAWRRTASEVARAYREFHSTLVRLATLTADELRCLRIWRDIVSPGRYFNAGYSGAVDPNARDLDLIFTLKSGYYGCSAALDARDLDLIRRLAVVGAKTGSCEVSVLAFRVSRKGEGVCKVWTV